MPNRARDQSRTQVGKFALESHPRGRTSSTKRKQVTSAGFQCSKNTALEEARSRVSLERVSGEGWRVCVEDSETNTISCGTSVHHWIAQSEFRVAVIDKALYKLAPDADAERAEVMKMIYDYEMMPLAQLYSLAYDLLKERISS